MVLFESLQALAPVEVARSVCLEETARTRVKEAVWLLSAGTPVPRQEVLWRWPLARHPEVLVALWTLRLGPAPCQPRAASRCALLAATLVVVVIWWLVQVAVKVVLLVGCWCCHLVLQSRVRQDPCWFRWVSLAAPLEALCQ